MSCCLDLGHERRQVDGERLGEPFEVEKANVSSAPLNVTHIARMQASRFGEPFLGQAAGKSKGPDGMAKRDEGRGIGIGGHLPTLRAGQAFAPCTISGLCCVDPVRSGRYFVVRRNRRVDKIPSERVQPELS